VAVKGSQPYQTVCEKYILISG